MSEKLKTFTMNFCQFLLIEEIALASSWKKNLQISLQGGLFNIKFLDMEIIASLLLKGKIVDVLTNSLCIARFAQAIIILQVLVQESFYWVIYRMWSLLLSFFSPNDLKDFSSM